MRWFTPLLLCLIVADAGAGDKDKPPPPARVTLTAELACMHCTFGTGDNCAACLKLDAKTPLPLAGKAAKQFEEVLLEKKLAVVTGTLSRDKDKQLVLTSDDARLFTDKDKDKAPAPGQARVEGTPVCGKCDLELCEECTLAFANGKTAIVLDGKHALGHAHDFAGIVATGRLFIDKRGVVRLDATKVDLKKK